jgi:hypothetical protein
MPGGIAPTFVAAAVAAAAAFCRAEKLRPPTDATNSLDAFAAAEAAMAACAPAVEAANFRRFTASADSSTVLLAASALSCTVISLATRRMLRRIVEYQWFFIALSVRPGSSFAISAHLLPKFFCAS